MSKFAPYGPDRIKIYPDEETFIIKYCDTAVTHGSGVVMH